MQNCPVTREWGRLAGPSLMVISAATFSNLVSGLAFWACLELSLLGFGRCFFVLAVWKCSALLSASVERCFVSGMPDFQSIGPMGRCYRLNVFLPPLLKVGGPILLEIQNPWGKVFKRSGLRFEHFYLEKGLKWQKKKKMQILPYKTRCNPCFPMD